MQQEDQHQQQLQAFWSDRLDEIEHMSDFKTHSLPLARIKKIMKASGENVQMIAGEAHGLLAKACEIFIQELTLRSWLQTRENNRRTLQKNDIAAAVSRNEAFDFLVDIMQDNGAGLPTGTMQTMVPGMGTFEMYCGNQQPVPFAWPQPQQQQSPHNGEQQHQPPYNGEQQQPPSSGGQDE
ncbi:nuclear transcription factor Y subunit C-4 [Brachypodium distachyon]|uniref:nuclear transcription factor Y subunit C-4 n=1 Tax=Brachypodium distachyon TaxID=15368 RepID=UPI000234FE28|nr:nuclear transcription factor Y subunit C-4 [Brachypodium distachyon]|eukprot:XP_003571524.1 nuclear transcription factor Y subunit C-4 [Brachypodium distachyon]